MKFNNKDIYTGHITTFEICELDGHKFELSSKIEFRGEYELFVKINEIYVPVRDITGLIRLKAIKNLANSEEIDWENLHYKNLDRMLVPYNYKNDHNEFLRVMKANGGRYAGNIKQVYPTIEGTKTLEELMSLRNKYKYRAIPIREDEIQRQVIESEKIINPNF